LRIHTSGEGRIDGFRRNYLLKRNLGKTGEDISILGLGGFHLLEISDSDALQILNTYLDEGGNYIETAAQYGEGESERKVGLVVKERRSECFLATKCYARNKEDAGKMIDQSLRRLNTDYVDLLFYHHVQTYGELDEIFSLKGAVHAFLEAKEKGKIRYIGISGHGAPDVLIRALQEHGFDAVMTGINFYDRFNFPDVEEKLIPLVVDRGIGIVGMKALADGLLWQYAEESIRYVLTLPITTIVCGANTREMLEKDLRIIREFEPMSEKERERLFAKNPVLGNYVCRRCERCLPCPVGVDIVDVFGCEGMYDRQLRDRTIRTAPEFALRDRLRFWFDNREKAKREYESLAGKADKCTRCGECVPKCPYGIDIPEKLENAHYKLTREESLMMPI
jgi:predicted aldo/keto reductase-like oxidoreductase